MTFVICTDVFMQGFVPNGSYSMRLMDYLSDERFILALDDRIYFEYVAMLRRQRFGFDKNDVNYFLKFIKETAKFVTAEKLKISLIDLHYLKFVEAAKSVKADALITKNTNGFKSAIGVIPVLTPREVFEKLI